MPQEFSELRSEFDRFSRLAFDRKWVSPAAAPIEVRITSADSPSDIRIEPLVALIDRLDKLTGVSLYLTGGGYGCFDLRLTSKKDAGTDRATAVERAISEDPDIQRSLNKMPAHEVGVQTSDVEYTFRAYNDLTFAIATNRKLASKLPKAGAEPRGLFGGGDSSYISYGVTDMSISDMAKDQPTETLVKRVWRARPRLLGGRRDHHIYIRKFDVYGSVDKFRTAVQPHMGKGAVVMVHGYANTFDGALDGFALAVHRERLPELQLLPVMFSWSAVGNPVLYDPDVNAAENSELQLLEVLDLLSGISGSAPLNVLAHSHGNKLLVRALTTKKKGRKDKSHWLKRIVLSEPDIDRKFLEDRASLLADAADRIVLYHSKNDRALWVAEVLFDSVRAGRQGVRPEKLDADTAKRLEIIDATDVSVGLMRHAPHIESAEVITDLHYLFLGQPPEERFLLRKVSAARWTIHSPLAR